MIQVKEQVRLKSGRTWRVCATRGKKIREHRPMDSELGSRLAPKVYRTILTDLEFHDWFRTKRSSRWTFTLMRDSISCSAYHTHPTIISLVDSNQGASNALGRTQWLHLACQIKTIQIFFYNAWRSFDHQGHYPISLAKSRVRIFVRLPRWIKSRWGNSSHCCYAIIWILQCDRIYAVCRRACWQARSFLSFRTW